jgi:tetratricopeptide (TPR) repeat protein
MRGSSTIENRSLRDPPPSASRYRCRPVSRRPRYEPVHLSDDIVRELHSTVRPGKGDILVKTFAEAASAFAAEDYDEAIRLGEQSKHMALRAIAPRELLGLAFYRAGKWQDAVRELSTYRRLSGLADQNPVLADCYRALRKPQKALDLCDEIRPERVPAPIAYEGEIVAAGALADMGHVGEAIERLERLDLNPKSPEEHHLRAWYVLGDLLERRGRFTQARTWFETVAAADPELTDAQERADRLKSGPQKAGRPASPGPRD